MKILFPALLLLASATALAQPARSPQSSMQHEAGVSWICAGIGAEERRVLDELRPQSRLEVLFVTAKRGGYVSDVELALYSGRDAKPLVDVTADGPICLIDAPPGAYRLEARSGGVTRTARATIARAGGRPHRVVFSFPDEPWDGIRASPEEKAQANSP
jgi:hypothetical protein